MQLLRLTGPAAKGAQATPARRGVPQKGLEQGDEGVQLVHSTAQAAAAAAVAVVHRRQMRHAYHISNAQTFKRAK